MEYNHLPLEVMMLNLIKPLQYPNFEDPAISKTNSMPYHSNEAKGKGVREKLNRWVTEAQWESLVKRLDNTGLMFYSISSRLSKEMQRDPLKKKKRV
jgi:hypothetical protein